jgi:hypothetical protein
MWIKKYSQTFNNITKEEVWAIWEDVNNYLAWHDDLELCQLDGEFKVGNHFKLKPKGGPTFKIEIVELKKYQRFVDCTHFFGAKMFDIHELKETNEGLRITSTLKVTGPLSFLWVLLVAKG